MTNNSGKELTPINPNSLPIRQVTPMPLDEARQILQAVVSTHESAITPATPLEIVAGFSTEQIREAATTVGLAVVSMHRGNSVFGIDTARKTTPYGNVSLSMHKRYDETGQPTEQYKRVYLALVQGGNYQIESEFPLLEPENDFDRIYVSYKDFRNNRLLSLYEIQKRGSFSLADFQHLFRGVRWLFANMLDWDRRDLIMPEQLNHLPLHQ